MISEADLNELTMLNSSAKENTEGGLTYVLLPFMSMPDGCSPPAVDLLLCVDPKDGYPSRLFFSQQVQSRNQRNWHVQNVRILERNWYAFSWRVQAGLRPVEILAAHLGGLR